MSIINLIYYRESLGCEEVIFSNPIISSYHVLLDKFGTNFESKKNILFEKRSGTPENLGEFWFLTLVNMKI